MPLHSSLQHYPPPPPSPCQASHRLQIVVTRSILSICPASYTLATNNNNNNNNNVVGIEDNGTADATVKHDGMNVDVCCINLDLFSAEVLVDVGTTWCDIIIE